MKGPTRFHPQMKGIVPFLDLLFVLLFSLLAMSDTKRSAENEAVRIQLPAVEPAGNGADPLRPTVVIEIDAGSNVRFAGRPEPIDSPRDLDEMLAQKLGNKLPEQFEVEIHGDARARHGVAVALLQHLRKKGFATVVLLAVGDEQAAWGGR